MQLTDSRMTITAPGHEARRPPILPPEEIIRIRTGSPPPAGDEDACDKVLQRFTGKTAQRSTGEALRKCTAGEEKPMREEGQRNEKAGESHPNHIRRRRGVCGEHS